MSTSSSSVTAWSPTGFVEALRARDTGSAFHVTVLAEEPRAPYDRVA